MKCDLIPGNYGKDCPYNGFHDMKKVNEQSAVAMSVTIIYVVKKKLHAINVVKVVV